MIDNNFEDNDSTKTRNTQIKSHAKKKLKIKMRNHVLKLIKANNLVIEDGTDVIFGYNKTAGVYEKCFKDELYALIARSYGSMAVTTKECTELSLNIKTELAQKPKVKMDDNYDIINFKNGVFDLKEFSLKPHSAEYLSSIQLNTELPEDFKKVKEKYEGGVFDKFMYDFTNGDDKAKELLLQFFGLMISNIPGYKVKKGLFLVSRQGNTGKSLLKNLISDIIGRSLVANIDLRDIEGRWGTGLCYKKRIVGSGDQSSSTIRELPRFKQMTGGDLTFAEKKGQNGFSYVFNGVFFCCANQLPRFGGDKGDHLYERFVIFEPKYSVPIEKQDRHLMEKLLKEKDYIIVLCLESLKRLINNDLQLPEIEAVKKSRKDYKKINNSFESFYEECVVKLDEKKTENGENRPITVKSMLDIYKNWCVYNHYGVSMPRRECLQLLNEYDCGRIKSYNGYNFLADVTIKRTSIEDYKKENENIMSLIGIPKSWK